MNILRTLIVEDEPLNREELRFLLESYEQIELVGEIDNTAEATDRIRHGNIDLVFLDIEMEEERSGLQLAEQLSAMIAPPTIIFVTSHSEYSLESYNYEPLHYLLKPINEDILDEALQRAFRLNPPTRLAVKYRKQEGIDGVSYPIAYVQPDNILYIQKNKLSNTIEVHLRGEDTLEGVRQTLDQFQQSLQQEQFARVHTSFIVNLAQVKELKQRVPNDENYCLVLNDSEEIVPVSKSRLDEVRQLLQRI